MEFATGITEIRQRGEINIKKVDPNILLLIGIQKNFYVAIEKKNKLSLMLLRAQRWCWHSEDDADDDDDTTKDDMSDFYLKRKIFWVLSEYNTQCLYNVCAVVICILSFKLNKCFKNAN